MSLIVPLVAGGLHHILTRGPSDYRDQVLSFIRRTPISEATATTALAVIAVLGLVRWANKKLSSLSHNAYRLGPAPGWNDWSAEVAVVTGGSSGIGLAITERFLAKGIKVAVLDMQPLKLKHKNVRFYQLDVTNPALVAKVAASVRKDLGNPSILINNAGIAQEFPILDMPYENLQKIFGVNTTCHWTLCKEFVPHMVKQNKGHVVTIASVASFVTLPGSADYSCTKASALAFHEGLTAELRKMHKAPNVLTTVVHPNFVATPLLKDMQNKLKGVPMLSVDRVAGDITKQVFKRKGAQLIIPGSSNLVSGMRGWPSWLQNFVRDRIAARNVATSKK